VREGWGTLGSWWLRLNSRFLSGLFARFGVTNFLAACGTTEVVPFPSVSLRIQSFPQGVCDGCTCGGWL
jgi:hypothetical protein